MNKKIKLSLFLMFSLLFVVPFSSCSRSDTTSSSPEWKISDLLRGSGTAEMESRINSSAPIIRAGISMDLVRARYYEGLFKHEYEKAYSCLNPEIKSKLSKHEFVKWWESQVFPDESAYKTFVGNPSAPSIINEKSIKFVKVLREYNIGEPFGENNQKLSRLSVVEILVPCSVNGRPGPDQRVIIIDCLSWDGCSAFISPIEFINLRNNQEKSNQ